MIMETAKRMTHKVVTVTPRDSLAKAKALMASGNFRHVPVVEDSGKLVGILSNSDIRWHGHLDATVEQAMTPNPAAIGPATTVEEAARLMLRLKISAVPVVVNGKPVGILSTSDILEAFLGIQKSDRMAELLRRTVGHGHMEF
jgi:acetoin utilization protein AcuB